jgi:hypothetical protein
MQETFLLPVQFLQQNVHINMLSCVSDYTQRFGLNIEFVECPVFVTTSS